MRPPILIDDPTFNDRVGRLIATGGDAALIAKGTTLFDTVDPLLTLRGLLVIAQRNELPY